MTKSLRGLPGGSAVWLALAGWLFLLAWACHPGAALAAANSAGSAGGSGAGGASAEREAPRAWWRALDGRLYRFADTDVSFSVKGKTLKTDWQYMMGAGYPVEPIKFRSPARLVAVFDFDCGKLILKFRPDLSAFSVSTDLWETGSHCETLRGVATLVKRP